MRPTRVQARSSGGRCWFRKGREGLKVFVTAPSFPFAFPKGRCNSVARGPAGGPPTRGRVTTGFVRGLRAAAASSRCEAGRQAEHRSAPKRVVYGRGTMKLLAVAASKAEGSRCKSSVRHKVEIYVLHCGLKRAD